MTIRIAIVGFGKIARREHVPAIAANPAFRLVAVVTPDSVADCTVPVFTSLTELLAAQPGGVDAVALCTPPSVRHAIAAQAIAAGLGVLLEKPPAATLSELQDLERRARDSGTCLYTAWHSQAAPAVAPAAQLLAEETIIRLAIDWREDLSKWHPGQDWIWEPGGFGVLDTGINALSIVSAILPAPLLVRDAVFLTPANRNAPIAATLRFRGPGHKATFDWRAQAHEVRSIRIGTARGREVALLDGGARLVLDGQEQPIGPLAEYPAVYARFAERLAARVIDVDSQPLRILADAARIARRLDTAAHV